MISPDDGGQQQLVVVLEGRQDGLTQQEVGEDPAGEDDEHGGDPEGERMLPRERQGAVGEVVSHSQAAEGCVGEVEVGEHLELGDLVGQVQEGLGVHLDLVLSLLSLLQGLVSQQSVSSPATKLDIRKIHKEDQREKI